MTTLTSGEISERLASIPQWSLAGQEIERTISFADFAAAMDFVNRVAGAAEKARHHPDIDIRWNKVRLALTTHDAGGLTSRDFEFAGTIDSLT